ncbi:hypothetical protein M427DRAFT_47779 [Gonapodya prolifera JEL478]|uniref:Uncharacterized protein n=1 Tax=Gonapodya prolifera (strain JEL478) TaxID=1344416 RepID=A0A139A2A6_GONPJ|nr:hypothetical protein M427DRAFT_47779 [Gonapodya prolifera JEL478]|eukprot:KXS10829.1 hypothetical protein M427DRAFT_47779 [Gonapodya prolifera JEL478]
MVDQQRLLARGLRTLRPRLRDPVFWITLALVAVVVSAVFVYLAILRNWGFARDLSDDQRDRGKDYAAQALCAAFTVQALIVLRPRVRMASAVRELWRLNKAARDGVWGDTERSQWTMRSEELGKLMFGTKRVVVDTPAAVAGAASDKGGSPGVGDMAVGVGRTSKHPDGHQAMHTTVHIERLPSFEVDQTDQQQQQGDSDAPEGGVIRITIVQTTFLVTLLNLNHIFQWPVQILMWAYASDHHHRPVWAVYLFIVLSFLCGVVPDVVVLRVKGRLGKVKKEKEKEAEEGVEEEGRRETKRVDEIDV